MKEHNNGSRSADKLAGSCTVTVLCGANAYEQKYYLNQEFSSLPQQVKDELQILCVMYTEEIGGIFTMEFDGNGTLLLKTAAAENDFMYDEIGGQLRIKQLMNDKQELFASLELYYKVFIKGEKL
ncbi:MAG TPA: hypothetical protein IAB17_02460 [Candidatus Alectryocaccobium stercorigallinarum]|nr:hypothetical protein [Candidatus Alectryocaccobium stercorigallinarum]